MTSKPCIILPVSLALLLNNCIYPSQISMISSRKLLDYNGTDFEGITDAFLEVIASSK